MENVYTRKPIEEPTKEHVVLNALGGQLTCEGLIDRTTNSRFGEGMDAQLAGAFLSVRLVLGALSGEGVAPPKFYGATGADGQTYNVLPGCEFELAKPTMRVWKEPGAIRFEGSTRSRKELRALVKNVAKKEGIPLERFEDDVRASSKPAPPMTMSITFGPETPRAIAKMATNLFARTNREIFMSPSFDAVRSFIADGSGEAQDFVQFNCLPVDVLGDERGMGELDHLVVVRHVDGEVSALVTIYGHAQWIVRLGRWDGPVRSTSYRVDQVGRAHRVDDARDRALDFPSLANTAAVDYEHLLGVFEGGMNRLLSIAVRIQRETFERKLIRRAMQEVIPDWHALTNENLPAVSRAITCAYVKYAADFGLLREDLR